MWVIDEVPFVPPQNVNKKGYAQNIDDKQRGFISDDSDL